MNNNYYTQNNEDIYGFDSKNFPKPSKYHSYITTASMILGIYSVVTSSSSFCCCFPILMISYSSTSLICGILAIIFASVCKTHSGKAVAGLICGIIGVLISLAVIIISISLLIWMTTPEFLEWLELAFPESVKMFA